MTAPTARLNTALKASAPPAPELWTGHHGEVTGAMDLDGGAARARKERRGQGVGASGAFGLGDEVVRLAVARAHDSTRVVEERTRAHAPRESGDANVRAVDA